MTSKDAKRSHKRGHSRKIFVGAVTVLSALSLTLPIAAQADPPTDDDINKARQEEDAAKLSVSQIEVQLAKASQDAQDAAMSASVASEKYNKAQEDLNAAAKEANKASDAASQARNEYEQGRKKLAAVAQSAYRSGGASLDPLSPYLKTDGVRGVESKRHTLKNLGSAADSKLQRVQALQHVSTIMDAEAQRAAEKQEKYTANVASSAKDAEDAAKSSLTKQKTIEDRKSALQKELAAKTNTTVELVKKREAELERQRQEAARKAAEEAARQEAARQKAAAEEAARQQAAAAAAAAQSQQQWQQAAPQNQQWENSAPAPAPADRGSRPAPAAPQPPAPAPAPAASGSVDAAVSWALTKEGLPYIWGGNGPEGYDCSGLVLAAYGAQGFTMGRVASAQYWAGTQVPLDQRQRGDLIFWSNGGPDGIFHVAIVIDQNTIFHAGSPATGIGYSPMWGWGQVMPYVVRF